MSIRPHTAWMTIAESTALGSAESNGAKKAIVSTASSAVVSPATWLRPPARLDAAVLDRLPATPKPPNSPELRFAAPKASSSWLASMRTPPWVANSRAALSPSASPTNAIAAPARRIAPYWLAGIPGSDGAGSPCGTSPTTATPRAARSMTLDTTSPPTRVTSAQGTFGASLDPTNIRARALTPTAVVAGIASSSPVTRSWMREATSPGGTAIPRMLGSSPMITRIVRPSTKPVTIGLDRNSATQPTCRKLAVTSTTPAPSAIAEATAMASDSDCGANEAIRVPDSTATVDTGPTIRIRDVPSRAYAISTVGIEYRPTCTGSPAMVA